MARYAEGRGVPENQKVAVKQFAAAADKGDAKAHFRLAVCYKTGTGVMEDAEAAHVHYRMAAAMGFEPAHDVLKKTPPKVPEAPGPPEPPEVVRVG